MIKAAWRNYFKWLSTPTPATAGLGICPYIKGPYHWVLADDSIAQVVLTVSDPPMTCQALRGRMVELNKALRPLGFMAVAIHPDDPFDGNGIKSRQAPQPAITITRLDVAIESGVALEKNSTYYKGWTEEHHNEGFPGCEDL